ncbi:MAG: hypothetical protein JNM93_11170 [Bacteriovoracaceae bacterium]|nr:hypothetical protein [Bacteriovoracaceae bacterium]
MPLRYSELEIFLIDDDELIREIWKYEASQPSSHINLNTFSNKEDFLAHLTNSPPSIKSLFFIDLNLSSEEDKYCGMEIASILSKNGYQFLYYVTGYEKNDIPHLIKPYITNVLGKEFPWKIIRELT